MTGFADRRLKQQGREDLICWAGLSDNLNYKVACRNLTGSMLYEFVPTTGRRIMGRIMRLRDLRIIIAILALLLASIGTAAESPAPVAPPAAEVLFRNVLVFDGKSASLSGPTDVLVRGRLIAAVGAGANVAGTAVTTIDGSGRTLMPGLIDAHTHIMFATLSQAAILTSDIGFVNVAATATFACPTISLPGRATTLTVSGSGRQPLPMTLIPCAGARASSWRSVRRS